MKGPATIDVRPMTRLFKALSDETRLRIVALLSQGELCVCHLEAALDAPQPTISRHLATLRSAGVVETRRDGTWVYYRLAEQPEEQVRRQLEVLVSGYADETALKREVATVIKTSGPKACR